MKKLRNFTAIICSVIVSTFVFQIFGFGASYAKEPDPKRKYALDVLCNTYLDFQELDTDKAMISNPFTVTNYHANQDDYDIFFVLSPDAVLGILTVGITDTGEYTSSFSAGNWKILNQAYQNKTSIALYASNKKLYLYNAEFNTVCELNTPDAKPERSQQTLNTTSLHISKINSDLYLNNTRSNNYYYQNNLLVPFVGNVNINGGICWAAAIASKCNYINNSSLTAITVYNSLNNLYGGTSEGTTLWVQRGYSLYGIPSTVVYNSVDCTVVYNNIYNNNPINIFVCNDTVAHSLLISGLTLYNNGNADYQLTDSNWNQPISHYVPESFAAGASDNFNYVTPYGYTFNEWYETIY